jgi:hypothetical protein
MNAVHVVLVTRTKRALINTFKKLKQEAEKYGLTINQNKTKYMRHSGTQTKWEGQGNRNRRNANRRSK